MERVTSESPAQQGLRFGVDSLTPSRISGWAIGSDPTKPVVLKLTVNGRDVGTLRADVVRDDLRSIRPDGKIAFVASPFDDDWAPLVAKGAKVQLINAADGSVLSETVWDGTADPSVEGVVDPDGSRYRLNKGRLVIPLSERTSAWRRELLDAAAGVVRCAQQGGFTLAATYGTLLGAVREGALIGHDDDVDLMFVSERGSMLSAIEDFHRLQDHLRGAGYIVNELSNGQVHVSRDDDAFPVDIFLAWFEGDNLSLTFTVKADVPRSEILPLGAITVEGVELPAPATPGALLEAIYGPGWSIPDPAFVWQRPDDVTAYFAPVHNYQRGANVDYWREYYASRTRVSPPQLPSQFALFALSVRPTPGMIVDLGCGSARDTLFFAGQKIKTLGLDYARTAIETNRATAEQRGLATHAMFRQVDVSDLAQVKVVQDFVTRSRPNAPLCVYSRFFFHALDENAEGAALMLISQLIERPDDFAVLEFRTTADEVREKVTPAHYRRYIDVDGFLRRARAVYDLECAYRAEGTGFAVFRQDDAHVARLVLTRRSIS